MAFQLRFDKVIRVFAIAAALALTGAAQAQPLSLQSETELRAEQMLAHQRSVALQNEIQALDARVRTEQALRNLEVQRGPSTTRLYQDEATQARPAPPPAPRGFASIPDDRLAASNARVREAARNR